jgi:tRNA dimethylallyltransferase
LEKYSRGFHSGIFQSIGFKEFESYFTLLNSKDDKEIEENKERLITLAVNEMKLVTRRYAKTQVRWIQNQFIKSKTVLF